MNVITLTGRIGKEVLLSKFPNSNTAYLDLLVIESYTVNTAKEGEEPKFEERTTPHTVRLFGKKAERRAKSLKVGDLVSVSGRQEHDQYEKDGEKKYFSYINTSKGDVQLEMRADKNRKASAA